jgi:hypothetical protein
MLTEQSLRNPYRFQGLDLFTGNFLAPLSRTDTGFEAFEIGKRFLYGLSSYTNQKAAIWDIRTGALVNELPALNEKKFDRGYEERAFDREYDKSAISPDFKTIAVATFNDVYLYSVEQDCFTYILPIDSPLSFFGVEDDGRTVWMFGSKKGTVTVADASTGETLLSRHLDYPGVSIRELSVNLKEGRVVLVSSLYANALGSDAGVYSLETGAKILSLSELLDEDTYDWLFSPDAAVARVNESYTSKIVRIPGFSDLINDTRKMAGSRVLTRRSGEAAA